MRNFLFLLFKKITKKMSNKDLWKVPGVIMLYRFIKITVKPKDIILISFQGIKMYVKADKGVGASLLNEGVYDKSETELFKKLIKPGMTVIDIGANIGYQTLIAAKLVGNVGRVFAFEPEPNNFDLLVKNIEINDFTNITPVQKALSNKNEKTRLFIDKFRSDRPSFSEENVPENAGFVNVETTTLDDFFENIVKKYEIDFVKMDAEGAEGLIIEGARKILRSNNLKLIIEFWPAGLKNVGTDPFKLLQKLQNNGFKIKLVDKISHCVKPIKIKEIYEMHENAKEKGSGKRFHVSIFLEKQNN